MIGMKRRLEALEAGKGGPMSPAVKAWLGQPLTAQEQAELDAGRGRNADPVDVTKLSQEMKSWLGLN